MRAQVEASSPAAKAALEELLAIARSYGVEVNPRLWLSERNGEMSVHADVADGETLIRLPEELLVPMDGAKWKVSGRDLSVVRHSDDATSAQRELADALVAVYNATRKVEWAQVGLPRVALLDVPDALAAIRTLRPGFAAQRVSVADAFLQTRVLRWSVGSTENVANEGRFLIPVIDLINHHDRGAPWSNVDSSLSISAARPAGDSQCFVRYRARQDPLDLALGYGFVDGSCTLARSIPVTVDMAGLGSIEVAGQHRQARSALDPPTVRVEADRLWLSHITFDARHPDRLAGVLQMAVSAFLGNKSRSRTKAEAATLTAALIGALLESNLVQLGRAQAELDGATESPAAGTVILAIGKQQRLLRHFQKKFASITQV